jgi:predicted acetyltransferase
MEARIRETWLSIGGLSDITTRIDQRHKGYFHRMTAEVINLLAERGTPIVALWPVSYPLYRSVGFELGSEYLLARFPPDALSFAASSASGSFSAVGPSDWQRLNDLYERYGTNLDLAIRRTEQRWRKRVLIRNGQQAYCYIWSDEDETDAGYVIYSIDGNTLYVRDIAYRDATAHQNLLQLLSYYKRQVEYINYHAPSESPLPYYFGQPSEANFARNPGPMFRLVDVVDAFDGVPAGAELAETVVLSVTDKTAPWNDDTYEFATDNGEIVCRRSTNTPDAEVRIGTLTQLFLGSINVDTATGVGSLRNTRSGVVDRIGSLLPERERWFREYI